MEEEEAFGVRGMEEEEAIGVTVELKLNEPQLIAGMVHIGRLAACKKLQQGVVIGLVKVYGINVNISDDAGYIYQLDIDFKRGTSTLHRCADVRNNNTQCI